VVASEIYLSECPLSDTSEKDEMEEVDIGIKVNDLWEEYLDIEWVGRGKRANLWTTADDAHGDRRSGRRTREREEKEWEEVERGIKIKRRGRGMRWGRREL
jgi:hypothetical protein